MDQKLIENLIDNAEAKTKEYSFFSEKDKLARLSTYYDETGNLTVKNAVEYNNSEMHHYIAIYTKHLLEELDNNGYLLNTNDSRSMREFTKRIMKEQEHILAMRKRGLAGY